MISVLYVSPVVCSFALGGSDLVTDSWSPSAVRAFVSSRLCLLCTFFANIGAPLKHPKIVTLMALVCGLC